MTAYSSKKNNLKYTKILCKSTARNTILKSVWYYDAYFTWKFKMGANADQKLDFGVTKTPKLLYSEPLHFYQHKFDAGYFKINLGNGYVVHVTKKCTMQK